MPLSGYPVFPGGHFPSAALILGQDGEVVSPTDLVTDLPELPQGCWGLVQLHSSFKADRVDHEVGMDMLGIAVGGHLHLMPRPRLLGKLQSDGVGLLIGDVFSGREGLHILVEIDPIQLVISGLGNHKFAEKIGAARWAKNFNLKQLSQTLIYLEENNLLDRSVLEERTAIVTAQYHTLSTKMKSAEQRMAEIKVLQQHIINYAKTRNTYVAYRKAGYSKKFLAEHESEIILHKAAKQFFDEKGLEKLPTVKSLQAEYAQLLSEKKAMYADYQKAKEDMRSLQTAKANVDRILGDDSLTTEREFEKDGR